MTQKILNQLIKSIYKVILVKVIEHGPRLWNHICWELVTPVLDNLANKNQHSSTCHLEMTPYKYINEGIMWWELVTHMSDNLAKMSIVAPNSDSLLICK